MRHLNKQLIPDQCGESVALPPPVVVVDQEGLPPQPFLKAQSEKLGGLFTVRTPSGKERIVLTDPELFDGAPTELIVINA
jgi:hypothetical protein